MLSNAQSFGTFWQPTLGLVVAGCLAFAGCGDGKIPRNQVHGVVKVDGQPAGGVMVILCPQGDGPPEFQKARPMGLTKPDGTFFVNTFGGGDGAPAGQYKILMSWLGPPAKGAAERDGGPAAGADRLQGRYNNLDKTPFTVDVKSGMNELPPFELKTH
jgi:hypothetical protein